MIYIDLCNLIPDCTCACGFFRENSEHFLLDCILHSDHRRQMLNSLNRLNVVISVQLLLFGDESLDTDINIIIFESVQKFIKDSKRFVLQ